MAFTSNLRLPCGTRAEFTSKYSQQKQEQYCEDIGCCFDERLDYCYQPQFEDGNNKQNKKCWYSYLINSNG